LLSFGAESFVFQFAIQKFKDHDIENYNIACCIVWIAHTEGETEAEGVWKIGC